ncbi:hypothetical protein DFP73DRAFT_570692 [Morchella snyderi]|nr:hypothetical protein DFP73DRAFT_570692 [Morchella snyderi]
MFFNSSTSAPVPGFIDHPALFPFLFFSFVSLLPCYVAMSSMRLGLLDVPLRSHSPGATGDVSAGVPGPRGDRGDRGPSGERGDVGERGTPGDPGERGPRGERGDTGDRGERGRTGAQGDRGPAGPRGSVGPPGVPDAAYNTRMQAFEERLALLEERPHAASTSLIDSDLIAMTQERDAAIRERDAARLILVSVTSERDATRNERDSAMKERDVARSSLTDVRREHTRLIAGVGGLATFCSNCAIGSTWAQSSTVGLRKVEDDIRQPMDAIGRLC